MRKVVLKISLTVFLNLLLILPSAFAKEVSFACNYFNLMYESTKVLVETASEPTGAENFTDYTLDWGQIGWVNPTGATSYPYVQTFTDIDGSGVNLTVTIFQEPNTSSGYQMANPGCNPDRCDFDTEVTSYMPSDQALRLFKKNNAMMDSIHFSFSEPVMVDNFMTGGQRPSGSSSFGVSQLTFFENGSVSGNKVGANSSNWVDVAAIDTITVENSLSTTAPINILEGTTSGSVVMGDQKMAYHNGVFYAFGKESTRRPWTVINFDSVFVQSFKWATFGTSTDDPATAESNLTASGSISAYISNFSFLKSNCNLNISSVNSQNCTEPTAGNFEADWQVIVDYGGEPTGNISYQRNSNTVGSFTPNTSPDTITLSGIPADGGAYDTIKVWFTNETICADTIILKRPVPCPTDVSLCVTDPGDFTLAIETENFTSKTASTGLDTDNWIEVTDSEASGGKAMQSLDNDGTIYSSTPDCCDNTGVDEAALLNYNISLPSAATYYAFIRTKRTNASVEDDSYHVGINGSRLATINNTSDVYSWYAVNLGSLALGTNSLNIWQREDGVLIDQIVISTASVFPGVNGNATYPKSICVCGVGNMDIAGTVWEDFNFDGTMNESDTVGVGGIKVDIYQDCNGGSTSPLQTTYTDSNGNYQFTGLTDGTTYRVEFTLPESISCWAKPTQKGTDNGTTVQFVTPGTCASLGIANPQDYCQANPTIGVSCFLAGDNEGDVFVTVPYNYLADRDGNINSSTTAFPSRLTTELKPTVAALNSEIGTTMGLAYKRSTKEAFVGAFVKRKAKLGALGNESPGAIYKIADLTTVGTPTVWADLNTLFANAAGTNPHPIVSTDWDNDSIPTVAQVYRAGLGDIEISDDEKTLYVVNLKDKKLYLIPTDVTPTAGNITVVPIPLSGYTATGGTCPESDMQPFGLGKDREGNIYVGLVCTGATSQNYDFIHAYILKMDASNNFEQVLDFSLRYREPVWSLWNPWTETQAGEGGYAQAVIGDIQFDGEDMILGLRDRHGDMTPKAYALYSDPPYPRTQGDILRVAYDNGAYVLESDACAGGNCTLGANPYNTSNGPPMGNNEYYYEEIPGDAGQESAQGALAVFRYYNEVISTAYDAVPYLGDGSHPQDNYNTGGFQKYHNQSGELTGAFDVFLNADANVFGKAAGLGDIELFCDPAPIEIGNYVWEDTDGDGIQDACEPALDSVIITLYNTTCEIIAIDTTHSNGQYYFNETKLREYTAQTDSVLTPNTTYYIVLSNAVGGSWTTADSTLTIGGNEYNLTLSNQGSNDLIDSDATIGTGISACNPATDGFAFVTTTTGDYGCVDYSFDIGFKPKLDYDYGDLPDIADGATGINDYETYDSTGGPSHQIITGLFLGDTVDIDSDGFPDAQALGDDNDGADDEDGITILSSLNVVPSGTIRLPLSVTNTTGDTAYVEAWIDWNGNGDFDNVTEIVIDLKDNKDGIFPTHLVINVPNTALTGSLLGFRIRLSNMDNMTPYGRINSGEVEDYLLGIDCPQENCLPVQIEIKKE